MVTYLFCAICPVCNIVRALMVALNFLNVDCSTSSTLRKDPAHISLYGGPLLFLSLQVLLFSAIVIWKDIGTFRISRQKHRSVAPDAERRGSFQEKSLFESTKSLSERKGLLVSNISKSYGSVKALENVSLEIGKEEVLALLGPNGAGKSTLISVIRGDIRPTGDYGDILVDGISVLKNKSSARAKLGVCPQIDGSFNYLLNLKLYFQPS
jgi:ATP-binding cassette, subfamily A (ABC1), member 3